MKEFLKYTFATVCGLIVFMVLCSVMMVFSIAGIAISGAGDAKTEVKQHSVYKLDLDGVVSEQTAQNEYSALFADALGRSNDKEYGLDDILRNIRLAKRNDKIDGIYLCGGNLSAGFAQRQEIRRALADFRESGKFVVAYADSYSQGNYWLASVADKLYVNDYGGVDWSGLSSSIMFYRRALEKLGIEMQVLKVGTYKSAVEPYVNTEMSEANREQMNVLLGDLWDEVKKDVAASRGLTVEKLSELADRQMMLVEPSELVAEGLVDSLIYSQDIKVILEQLTGTENYHVLNHSEMLNVPSKEKSRSDKVAVIYAEGAISDNGSDGIVGKKMVKLIDKLRKKDEIKAVVLRVNSPGGSAYASEQIWHALELLKAEKPLVVSMSDYAASGGYYISCGADYIYAEENTLTGSIGIFGLVPNVSGLRDKLGLDIDGVGTNKLSQLQTNMIYKGMNDEERELMQAEINRGYERFVSRCAEGRGMSTKDIKQIAEGRVWSGKRAVELGLVDGIGNLADAIKLASEKAELDKYSVSTYPDATDKWMDILNSLIGQDDEERVLLSKVKEIRQLMREPSLRAELPYKIYIR